jgi:hypothetical protein
MIASYRKANVCVCVAYGSPQTPHDPSFVAVTVMSVCIAISGFNRNLLLWGKLVSFHSSQTKVIVNTPIKLSLMNRNHSNMESEKKAVEMNKFIYCFIPMKYFPRAFGIYPRRDISNTNVTIKYLKFYPRGEPVNQRTSMYTVFAENIRTICGLLVALPLVVHWS